MKVTALGVGDAFSARWYSSCLLVEEGDARLLVDCPHPVRKMLKEARPDLDLGDVDGLVLTHLHADHASGVEGLLFFERFVLRRRARLWAHPDVSARLWEALAPSMDRLYRQDLGRFEALGLDDYAEVTALSTERAVDCGPFSVECRPTRHHIPTTALRISAGGRTLAYSADTSYDEDLIAWLESRTDLIVHEVNLGTHTPYEKLVALPEPIRARMRLIHYLDPEMFDPDASAIPCMRQGETLQV